MLFLRPDHRKAFQAKTEEDFVFEVLAYLRKNHASAKVKLPKEELKVSEFQEEALERLVIAGINKARTHQMTSRGTIKAFITIMFVSSPNFYEHPQVKRVFKSSMLPPNLRINLLWTRTTNKTWEEIESNYNPATWFDYTGD